MVSSSRINFVCASTSSTITFFLHYENIFFLAVLYPDCLGCISLQHLKVFSFLIAFKCTRYLMSVTKKLLRFQVIFISCFMKLSSILLAKYVIVSVRMEHLKSNNTVVSPYIGHFLYLE